MHVGPKEVRYKLQTSVTRKQEVKDQSDLSGMSYQDKQIVIRPSRSYSLYLGVPIHAVDSLCPDIEGKMLSMWPYRRTALLKLDEMIQEENVSLFVSPSLNQSVKL